MAVDLSFLPDQKEEKKPVDFSFLPDKRKEKEKVVFSFLPDKEPFQETSERDFSFLPDKQPIRKRSFIKESFIKPTKTVMAGIHKATAETFDVFDYASDKLANALGVPETKNSIFEMLRDNSKYWGERFEKEGLSPGIARSVYEGIGNLAWKLPQYAIATKVFGVFGLGSVSAFDSLPKGKKEMAKSFLKGTMMQGVLRGTSYMPLKLQVPSMAALFSGQTAMEGGNLDNIVASGILGIGLSALGRHPTMEQFLAPYKNARTKVKINKYYEARDLLSKQLQNKGIPKQQARWIADEYAIWNVQKRGDFTKVNTKDLNSTIKFLKTNKITHLDPEFTKHLFAVTRQRQPFHRPSETTPKMDIAIPRRAFDIRPKEKPTIAEKPKISPLETRVSYPKEFERVTTTKQAYKLGRRMGKKEMKNYLYKSIKAKDSYVKDIKQTLVDYANQYLTLNDRGKLLARVKNVKTKHGLERSLQMVDIMEDRYQRKEAVGSLYKTIKSINTKQLRPEYKNEIEGLIKSVDLVNRKEKTINRLSSIRDYISKHPDNNIPDTVLHRLEILEKTPIKELTTDDINLINDSIRHFKRLNDLKNKLIFGNVYKDFFAKRDQAIANIEKGVKRKIEPQVLSTKDKMNQANRAMGVVYFDALPTEYLTEVLDGKPDGVIRNIIYEGFNEGVRQQLAVEQFARDFIRQNIPYNLSSWSELLNTNKKDINYQQFRLSSGKTIEIMPGDKISLYKHSLNEKNLRHLLNGGFRFMKNPAFRIKLTSEDIETITNSMSPEELHVAEVIGNYLDTIQKRLLNERSIELNGTEIATEENYWRIRTSELDRQRDELRPKKTFSQITLEGLGFLQERTNANNALILEDAFYTFYKSLKNAAAYYGLAKPLRNAKMLAHDSKFRQTIMRNRSVDYVKTIDKYLKDLEANLIDLTNLEKLSLDLVNNMHVAYLGVNPTVALKQVPSLVLAQTEMPARHFMQGIIRKSQSPELMSRFSPEIRDRTEGRVTREMGEIANIGEVMAFFTDNKPFRGKLTNWIKNRDIFVIGKIWNMAESFIKDTQPELQGDDFYNAVARKTEDIIHKTQPNFHPKDRAAIARTKNPLVRGITSFFSQREKIITILFRSVLQYQRSNKTLKDKSLLAKNIGLVTIVSASLITAIDRLRDLVLGRKRKTRLHPSMKLATDIINTNLGAFYVVGPLASSFISKWERGTYAGYGYGSLLGQVAETVPNFFAESTRALEQMITQERYESGDKTYELKYRNSMSNAIKNLISLIGMVKGLPLDTARRILEAPFKERGETKRRSGKIRPIQPMKK